MITLSKDVLRELYQVDPLDTWRIIKAAGVKYVKFVIVDIHGRPKSQIIPIDAAKDVFIDGARFDGSSIPCYATVNRSDLVAYPDHRAVYIESWNGGRVASVFTCVVDDSGYPSPLDPRGILMQVLHDVRKRGFDVKGAPEVEYFIVRDAGGRPELVDPGVYFEGYNTHMLFETIADISANFELAGLGLSKTHHEVAPSQYEINIPFGDPVRASDSLLMFKIMAKDVAKRHGFLATFMPKPFWGINGSGMHMHISLYDVKTGRNLFASDGELTDYCRYAIGGLLKYARETSVILAPTVNSYKRLVPGHEAPTRITWGRANRSALIRVPYYGRKINRIEHREPDPSCNPYLAFAVITIEIIKGIDGKIDPGRETEEIAYELKGVPETPGHLGDAIDLFEKGEIVRELPSELVKRFVEIKRREWEDYAKHYRWEDTWCKITDWEYARYLYTA